MLINYIEILGYIAGALSSISFFPQIYQMIVTKSAKDVSLPMFLTLFAGCILWALYGTMLGSESMVVINIFDAILALIIVILKIKLDKRYKK